MIKENNSQRIGVYICHCGTNISHTVDIKKLVEYARTLPDVAVVREYKYMCSEPGQDLIKKDIEEDKLTRVVVSSCSPLMHEETFRNACEDAGLNRFLFQMSNIREQCSWVHSDREKATAKAKRLITAAVRRVKYQTPMEQREAPVHPDTLVVGGGIAGIEAALKIADSGKKVYLVEKEPSIGGHMAQFDKTFPTLDCAACILTPKMVQVGQHPNIELMTYSEVEEVSGYVGNFKAKIRRKARYVDESKCTGCGECMRGCLVRNVAYLEPDEEPEIVMEPDEAATMQGIMEKYREAKGAIVPALQDTQMAFNYLPENALRYISREMEVPLGKVYRLATFYNAFSLTPQGKHVIRICMGTACYVKGGNRILEAFEDQLGIGAGDITRDQQFSLETVNCLGCCGQSPVIAVDEKIYGYFKQTDVRELIKEYS
ncbi:MAG: NAD(P)H-dependent oxidoreductase subunit E [Sedimentisphaerales bacterium]|nr:NAD(P)H-dependent oxidoreductase subunit E [Sedimentisphaerales bacterium]